MYTSWRALQSMLWLSINTTDTHSFWTLSDHTIKSWIQKQSARGQRWLHDSRRDRPYFNVPVARVFCSFLSAPICSMMDGIGIKTLDFWKITTLWYNCPCERILPAPRKGIDSKVFPIQNVSKGKRLHLVGFTIVVNGIYWILLSQKACSTLTRDWPFHSP